MQQARPYDVNMLDFAGLVETGFGLQRADQQNRLGQLQMQMEQQKWQQEQIKFAEAQKQRAMRERYIAALPEADRPLAYLGGEKYWDAQIDQRFKNEKLGPGDAIYRNDQRVIQNPAFSVAPLPGQQPAANPQTALGPQVPAPAGVSAHTLPAPTATQTPPAATPPTANGPVTVRSLAGRLESNNQPGIVNKQGYSGKYQFGEAAAEAAGFYEGDTDPNDNVWTGRFRNLPGVGNLQEFLQNEGAQDAAWDLHEQHLRKEITRLGLDKYVGQTVAGVPITAESLIGMMHLGGPFGTMRFIRSGGRYDPADANGTKISDYGRRFSAATPAPAATAPPATTAAASTTAAPTYPPNAVGFARDEKTGQYVEGGQKGWGVLVDANGNAVGTAPLPGSPEAGLDFGNTEDAKAVAHLVRSGVLTPQQGAEFLASKNITGLNGQVSMISPTGKVTAIQAPQLSNQDKELIVEADRKVEAGTGAIASLRRALQLNDQAYSGLAPGFRSWLGSNVLPDSMDDRAVATAEFQNIILSQALDSLKAIFGAAPTEGERKILVDLQASADKAPAVRKVILENAIRMAERRLERERARAEGVRKGTYYGEGSPPPPEPPKPPPGSGDFAGKSREELLAIDPGTLPAERKAAYLEALRAIK